MKKQNGLPSGFAQSLERIRQRVSDENTLLQGAAYLQSLSHFDGICGSWVACGSAQALLIRREGNSFRMLLTDNSRCFKSILNDMSATLVGKRLMIVDDGTGKTNGEITLHEDGSELVCGSFGSFRSEENLLRQEMFYEMDSIMNDMDDEC